jgi:hypothetical protein
MQLDVVYCEGWNPESRSIAGPLSASVARERDEAGEQYAVLVVMPAENHPVVLIQVYWRHHYVSVWHFDEMGRRKNKLEFRRLADDRLFLIENIGWGCTTPRQKEFDERGQLREGRYELDGKGRETSQPEGTAGSRSDKFIEVPVSELTQPVP